MLKLKLEIDERQLRTLLFVFVVANILLLLGTAASNTWGANSNNKIAGFLLAQSDLTRENVIASWYSAMLLLLAAVISFICFLCDGQFTTNWKSRLIKYGWLVFCAIFLLLSLDEMGSFHEMIGDTNLLKTIGFGEGGGWNAFYFLVGLAGLFMITFFIIKFRRNKWSLLFALAGVLLYLSNPFQEVYEIESYRLANMPSSFERATGLLLLEEGSEIFGSLSFVMAFTLYIIYNDRAAQPGIKTPIHLKINTSRKKMFSLGSLLVFFFAFVMMAFFLNHESMLKGDDGIAVNWFPSSVSFLLCFYFLYHFSNRKKGQNQHLLLMAFAALACLAASAYFGSNFYAEPLLRKKLFSVVTIQSVAFGIMLLLEWLLFLNSRQNLSKLFLVVALVLTVLLFFIKPTFFPVAGFALFSAILFATTSETASHTLLPTIKNH